MLNLELLARRFGNPGEGPPGGESGCPVQGGPGCATWGSGPVWGDGYGGMGYAKEYFVERYFREAMIARIAPVSREMILNFIAERVLGLPKSY